MTTPMLLIVDTAAEKRARQLFPTMEVVANAGPPEDGYDASGYAGRQVLLWCHYAPFLAEKIVATAEKVGIVNSEHYPLEFNGNANHARVWLQANITRYEAHTPEPAVEQPDGVREAPAPAVDVPAAIEAAKTDAGALFEPAVLDALQQMRREQPAEYQRIRAQAKETAASVTELDRLTGPKAPVVSITEARTTQQERPREAPLPGEEASPLSDDALASAFTAKHGELRYVAQWNKWLRWQDGGWREDTTLGVYDMARAVCREQADVHRGYVTPDLYTKARSAGKRAAVENLARSDRAHAASTDQWDVDPMALNTPGGLVNLCDGSIRPARIDDYCRKLTDATPSYYAATRWLDFLKFGTNGDDDLADFLQLWAGYSATGETKEQKFVFIHGPGGAGKGTFVNTVARVLGSYARKIAMDTLVDTARPRDGGAPSEDIAGLAGARMGYASETEQGRRWNESRLKEITGEDKVRARFMAKDSFEFQPVIKLTIMGNHPPGLKSVGNDMIRRTLIVPFEHLPPQPDGDLRDKLWAERDAILGWIIAGAVRWRQTGLVVPASVQRRSEAYFENQDVLGQWIADKCEMAGESTIRSLYPSYRSYCESCHEFALRQGELRDALLARNGISKGGYTKAPTLKGIRVKVDPDANSRFPD